MYNAQKSLIATILTLIAIISNSAWANSPISSMQGQLVNGGYIEPITIHLFDKSPSCELPLEIVLASGNFQLCASWEVNALNRSLSYHAQGGDVAVTWRSVAGGAEGSIYSQACDQQGCQSREARFFVAPMMASR